MKKIITSDMLKIIGIVSMLSDHCAVVFTDCGLPEWIYWTMRGAGRLAFPIFAYFIAQGYIYTHSVAKYVARLFITALISEIPYNMAVFGRVWYFGRNNILFTFALALFVLWISDRLFKKGRGYIPVMAVIAIWAMALSYILGLDYSWRCILLVAIFYYATEYPPVMYTSAAIVMISGGSAAGLVTPLSLIPIHMHDGQKGRLPRIFIQLFYPVHLLVLGIVRMLLI